MVDHSRPPRPGGLRTGGGDGDPEVFCADEQDDVPLDLARWHALTTEALRAEGVRGACELSVLFVSELAIAELNETYMGSNGSTDVLAFPIDAGEMEVVSLGHTPNPGPHRAPVDPGEVPLLLGDVVICPAVAARQAPDHAGSLDDEIALLLVHGILHVLGHDHAEAEEAQRMRARELVLLEQLHWRGPAPGTFLVDRSS